MGVEATRQLRARIAQARRLLLAATDPLTIDGIKDHIAQLEHQLLREMRDGSA